MAIQTFLLGDLLMGEIRGFGLGKYKPYWIRNAAGERVRNPKWDDYSRQVLTLKQPQQPDYRESVRICSALLRTFLTAQARIPPAEILIIPSSTAGKYSPGLELVTKYVCKNDARFSYRAHALRRVNSIDKLAKGGDRSLQVHLNSMEYVASNSAPRVKILLDDIKTTGHSLEAAMLLIQQVARVDEFIPVVFGVTSHD